MYLLLYIYFAIFVCLSRASTNLKCFIDQDSSIGAKVIANFSESKFIQECAPNEVCLGYGEMHNGVLSMKKFGCFSEKNTCSSNSTCMFKKTGTNRFLCCCTTNLCNDPNRHVYIPQNDTYISSVKPPSNFPLLPVKNTSVLMFAMLSLLPLLTLSIVVIAAFYIYRRIRLRRKCKLLSDMVGANVAPIDTPDSLILVKDCDLAYRLEEEIASGRYGSVYLGRSVEHYAPVAVKVFLAHHRASWMTEQAMLRSAGVQHTNVLRLLGTQQLRSGHLWLVTEYHSLGSVFDYLHTHTLSLFHVIRLGMTMARGLAHLHKFNAHKPSIAHRDFKSRNVLIKDDMTACVADLGLAIKFESREPIGDTHNQVGTRRYMAPEVLEGAIHFTRDAFLRIDMYAMSLVLWELMSRCALTASELQQPYDAFDAAQISPMAYQQPFHEAGDDTPMDVMQDLVVYRKKRPQFPVFSEYNAALQALKNTIEECWDQDAEARLSASCVVERLLILLKNWQGEDGGGGFTDGDSGMIDNEEIPSDHNDEVEICDEVDAASLNENSPLSPSHDDAFPDETLGGGGPCVFLPREDTLKDSYI